MLYVLRHFKASGKWPATKKDTKKKRQTEKFCPFLCLAARQQISARYLSGFNSGDGFNFSINKTSNYVIHIQRTTNR